MKNLYDEMPNGYQESIQKGLGAVRYFSRNMTLGTGSKKERIARLKKEIEATDAVVIGAGAGLTYSGERFERYFFDFARKYGIRDMYSGGFYPFPDEETRWVSVPYADFLRRHESLHVLYLELGVGANTPVIRLLNARINNSKRQQNAGFQYMGSIPKEERWCA